ncbi:hypothetical protein BMR1_03g00945 [Babesia microti strain RI]|uniref:Casein kinase substrate phosphoprotein PP28 domain-containing protein n=1 Tax=Babesia microti (strain RI) TaxID=1133968 RepID=A0A1R4ABD0_BABMR|nr:hypothetical protein BMR1_03g00945 [Babesia microti strain RI]SJK86296.1 hypothetical protein BMR1_03g00945 [Babesia microti strain RI]|eukprot:XP_021338472.1 hypothetical protein BMR1_03g00945 [Babesia microti strain RI]
MSSRGRGGFKKYKPRGRRRFATDDEVIARNEQKSASEESSPVEESIHTDSSDSDSSVGDNNRKGIPQLIDKFNPNHQKLNVEKTGVIELSRREREELERQRRERIQHKLHMQCKTKADQENLARLAEIRKRREEAAKARNASKSDKNAEDPKESNLTKNFKNCPTIMRNLEEDFDFLSLN